jgi:hypothetical protein
MNVKNAGPQTAIHTTNLPQLPFLVEEQLRYGGHGGEGLHDHVLRLQWVGLRATDALGHTVRPRELGGPLRVDLEVVPDPEAPHRPTLQDLEVRLPDIPVGTQIQVFFAGRKVANFEATACRARLREKWAEQPLPPPVETVLRARLLARGFSRARIEAAVTRIRDQREVLWELNTEATDAALADRDLASVVRTAASLLPDRPVARALNTDEVQRYVEEAVRRARNVELRSSPSGTVEQSGVLADGRSGVRDLGIC